MKKTLAVILAVITVMTCVLSFVSCSSDPTPKTTAPDNLAAAYDKLLANAKAPTSGSNGTLTIATSPDFAPMEFVDTAKSGAEKYVGFDILLANYLAKELDMTLEIKPMSFDACLIAAQTGKADLAVSGFSWTAERADNFLISDYYVAGENETEQVVITTKAKENTFKNASDFAGLKVGCQGGSLQKLLVGEQLVVEGASLVEYEDLNVALAALIQGKIDALAVAKGNGDAYISKNQDTVAFSGFEFEIDEKYKNNVILLNKNDTELLEKVNTVLAKAMASGVYTSWYEACQIYSGISTIDELGYDDDGNKITE